MGEEVLHPAKDGNAVDVPWHTGLAVVEDAEDSGVAGRQSALNKAARRGVGLWERDARTTAPAQALISRPRFPCRHAAPATAAAADAVRHAAVLPA
jgi:hypothetical protein